jgi:hypothetical protein
MTSPSKLTICEEKVVLHGMELRRVYSWGEIFTIPILGFDGMPRVLLNSFLFWCPNCSSSFVLASSSTATLSFSIF